MEYAGTNAILELHQINGILLPAIQTNVITVAGHTKEMKLLWPVTFARGM